MIDRVWAIETKQKGGWVALRKATDSKPVAGPYKTEEELEIKLQKLGYKKGETK